MEDVSDGGESERDDGKRDFRVTGGYEKAVRVREPVRERVILSRRGATVVDGSG